MNNDKDTNEHNIDLPRLRAARRDLDARILALKQALRARWDRPMHEEQRMLVRLKHEATGLCVLRAHMRGRWHLPDHDACAATAAALAPRFRRAAEAAA